MNFFKKINTIPTSINYPYKIFFFTGGLIMNEKIKNNITFLVIGLVIGSLIIGCLVGQ